MKLRNRFFLALWVGLLSFSGTVLAQSENAEFPWNSIGHPVQCIEGEVMFGFGGQLGGFPESVGPSLGMAFATELRYNFRQLPVDVGVHFGTNGMMRTLPAWWQDPNSDAAVVEPEEGNVRYRNMTVAVVADWNFRQGHRVNPFAGVGLGFARNRSCPIDADMGLNFSPKYHTDGTQYGAIVMPRVGVELFRHLRLMTTFNITRCHFHNATFTLGVAIGGRPRR
ncbi:MAG: hypothetical protein HUK02_03615 [Bacteroidaceae bacterium]|nr:hypothetical protein [Bacteroidaceae bacterium]